MKTLQILGIALCSLVLAGGVSAAEPARPYFPRADWLWEPIPADPVFDPQSAAMVNLLKEGKHSAALWNFGVTLRGPEQVSAGTPRYDIEFANVPKWGTDPFGEDTMPIPTGTPIPPGSDGQVSVVDPANRYTYNLWQAVNRDGKWSATWGAKTPLDGDGRDPHGYASTGSGLNRYGTVVRASDIAAGHIPHALFFATDMAALRTVFRYPATQSDGKNIAGVATPIPQGARVQLDPSIDVDAIPGITPFEKIVAKALQTYGAYCGDSGRARMGFLFEFEGGKEPGATYRATGAPWDYFEMSHIPWDRLRVLKTWNGR